MPLHYALMKERGLLRAKVEPAVEQEVEQVDNSEFYFEQRKEAFLEIRDLVRDSDF